MIISCPQCARDFEVEAVAFSMYPEGRTVRCSGCFYQWTYLPPVEVALVVEAPIQKKPPRRAPVATGFSGLLTGLVFVATLLMVIFGGSVLLRHHVVLTWPVTASFYQSIGISVVVSPKNFIFKTVTWGQKREEGKSILWVKGNIVYKNETERSRPVPGITIFVYGPGVCSPQGILSKVQDGMDAQLAQGLCLLDQWSFKPQTDNAIPGEVISFKTERVLGNGLSPQVVAAEFQDV